MNPKGVMAINSVDRVSILCCPAELRDKKVLGCIQVKNLNKASEEKPMIIQAHTSTLSILELNDSGSLVASASEKGTLIRIFCTKNGHKLQELRRGSEYAMVFSLSFHFEDQWLTCISDSGTLHVFNLLSDLGKEKLREKRRSKAQKSKNRKSMLAFMSFLSTYFGSEYSFAHFKNRFDARTKVFFLANFKILLVSYGGNMSLISFDKITGGDCKEDLTGNFFMPFIDSI